MSAIAEDVWLAGVDGCPGGWIAAFVRPQGEACDIALFAGFAAIAAARPLKVIAIDMPIGLPARTGPGGRAAENAVRPLLGARQSSVFSVPSRAAVHASDYRTACEAALPPPIRRARCRSSCSTSRPRSARWTRRCAPMPISRRASTRCIRNSRSGG